MLAFFFPGPRDFSPAFDWFFSAGTPAELKARSLARNPRTEKGLKRERKTIKRPSQFAEMLTVVHCGERQKEVHRRFSL